MSNKIKTTCFIKLLYIHGEIVAKNGEIKPIERHFDVLPRIGEAVSLFSDGITSDVDNVEHNFDGSVSLVFKGRVKDYEYYKEMTIQEPSNLLPF